MNQAELRKWRSMPRPKRPIPIPYVFLAFSLPDLQVCPTKASTHFLRSWLGWVKQVETPEKLGRGPTFHLNSVRLKGFLWGKQFLCGSSGRTGEPFLGTTASRSPPSTSDSKGASEPGGTPLGFVDQASNPGFLMGTSEEETHPTVLRGSLTHSDSASPANRSHSCRAAARNAMKGHRHLG